MQRADALNFLMVEMFYMDQVFFDKCTNETEIIVSQNDIQSRKSQERIHQNLFDVDEPKNLLSFFHKIYYPKLDNYVLEPLEKYLRYYIDKDQQVV